ncbi:hypothetical protein NIES3974_39360 [Calothrix sp. NIES-3974]|nr:hypothetical protein NIES3974_39360 [Calothrix sp. NIES-3974]
MKNEAIFIYANTTMDLSETSAKISTKLINKQTRNCIHQIRTFVSIDSKYSKISQNISDYYLLLHFTPLNM